MTQKRLIQTYDSFQTDEETSSLVQETPEPSKTRTFPFRKTFGILGIFALFALFNVSVPSHEEAEYLQDYKLSPFSYLRQLRRLQSIADSARATFLTDNHKFYKRAFHKLDKHVEHSHSEGVQEGCEATVVIIRHCEKGKIREHCDYLGYERSVYLATLFGDREYERWPSPSHIFALNPGGRKNKAKLNFREVETVGALAEKANVTIDTTYPVRYVNDLAKDTLALLEGGELCGKLVLISWKHSNIGHLASHLGCGPMQGCPLDYRGKDFDVVWQIKYLYNTPHHSAKKSLKKPKEPEWRVFGSVQNEGFDPLAFSKQLGDYPRGGTSHGARWRESAFEIPERSKETKEKDTWPKDAEGIVDEAS